MKTLSLCLTNHNRDKMLIESFQQVLDDDRVSEIVVVDDFSDDRFYDKVKDLTNGMDKVKLFRNRKNLGCYKNKREAIAQAQNEFVIIFDSDNIMTKEYIDKVYEREWDENIIFAPDYIVSFNYRNFSDRDITKNTVRKMTHEAGFDCLINTMNYFVHRDNYLAVWDGSIEPWTADTLYQNFRWIESGRTIHVLKGLEYDHRIKHEVRQEGSHYMQHHRKTGNLFNTIIDKLRRMQ